VLGLVHIVPAWGHGAPVGRDVVELAVLVHSGLHAPAEVGLEHLAIGEFAFEVVCHKIGAGSGHWALRSN